jgi:hypothetical protein
MKRREILGTAASSDAVLAIGSTAGLPVSYPSEQLQLNVGEAVARCNVPG